ncbi:MAG: 5'-methylthioadenosine/S-adenosylhomocysteine nucleosidase, partial [Clostridia bacterium]|nr:5'-methylthioadenosine/S-adenosylhomocysteine nucleosidase [Clostridia bacterium]
GKDVFLAKCGIGEIASSAATALLIGKFECSYIINFGLVGTFRPEYRGALVAVKDVVHYDFDLTAFGQVRGCPADFTSPYFSVYSEGLSRLSAFDLPLVRLASGDKFISDPLISARIASDFSADICDMEGAGIAITCARAGIPFNMIKLVSDGADSSATADFAESKTKSFGRAFEIVLSLIRQA